jgi:hypothetical protein
MGRFLRVTVIWYCCLLALPFTGRGQEPPTENAGKELDSLIALLDPGEYDSLMKELDLFFGDFLKKERSFFDLSVSAGNHFFSLRESYNATGNFRTVNRVVYGGAFGYFHKSGLSGGISLSAASASGKLSLYQQQYLVSYDYVKSKNFSAGISYIRQKVKDSVDFYASPFKHIAGAYFNYRKSKWQPGISFSYGKGSYTEVLPRLYPLSYKVNIKDFTGILSLRRSFVKYGWISEKDFFQWVPRIMLIGAAQQYEAADAGSNRRLQRLFSSGLVQRSASVKFQPQSLALNLSADYARGIWYVHPQLYADYYLHTSDQRLLVTFTLLAGIMF